jgi:signal transduction histidine kinase
LEPTVQILILIVLTTSVIAYSVFYFDEAELREGEKRITDGKINEVKLLASRTELRLNDAAGISGITGNIPLMSENIRPELIDPTLHGVPQDSEMEKREVARLTLEKYDQLRSVALLLPNGDVYLVEPYSAQKNLTRTNFSYRDYYQGAVNSGSQYIGDVIHTTTSNRNVVPIATPLKDDNGTLKAIWVTSVDLSVVDKALSKIGSEETLYVLTDKDGATIAKSEDGGEFLLENYGNFTSFKNASLGGSGYAAEKVNGIMTFVAYTNVVVNTKTWAVLSFQSYDEVYAPIVTLRDQTLLTIVLIVTISGAFGAFLLNSFRALRDKEGKLKVALEEVKSAEKAKNEFISMLSHELKTPLLPIKGYSDMLLQQGLLGDLNEKQRKAAQLISRSSDKLETLVQDVLAVYKLEMDKMTFAKTDVAISDLVQRSIEDLKTTTTERQIEVHSEIKTSGTVYCDPKRIDQVFSNLIKNSIDFVPKKEGKITVKVEQGSDSQVVFSVEDNGQGIPVEKVDKLFQKFYQIDASTTRRHGGTGLGLVICKGIVEAHGGEIWIDRDYTSGASVKFSLPRSGISKEELAA